MTNDSADDSKNLESDVRFEIESNHEASQVPTTNAANLLETSWKPVLPTQVGN